MWEMNNSARNVYTRDSQNTLRRNNSNRLHRNKREVVDKTYFFLHKGLAITYTGQQTVMTSFGEGPVANLFLGDKQSGACGLVGILRGISHQSLMPLLDERCDIYDETRTHIGVEACIDNLERPVRMRTCVYFRHPCQK